jgi:hypothetical protein
MAKVKEDEAAIRAMMEQMASRDNKKNGRSKTKRYQGKKTVKKVGKVQVDEAEVGWVTEG